MRRILAILLLFWWVEAQAQPELEIIPLRARTVEQVLPVLLPLVETGGVLSGANNQLFLRASKRNRDEIKRALAALDVPLRQLVIQVSRTRGAEAASRGGEAEGRVVLGTHARVDANARVWSSRSQHQDSSDQSVQTVEGGRAFIQIGVSLPVPMRQTAMGPQGAVVTDTVVYRDIGQGFYVQPRLSGNRVTLEISQQSDTPDGHRSGSAQVQRLMTTVSGRLGEWIQLGGTGQQASGDQRGTLNLSTRELRDRQSIWLKVDEVR